jgi:hypothetical protein
VGIADGLSDLIESPEFQTGATAGFGKGQTGLSELLDELIEVKAQFFVELAVDGAWPKDGTQPDPEVRKHGSLPRVIVRPSSYAVFST